MPRLKEIFGSRDHTQSCSAIVIRHPHRGDDVQSSAASPTEGEVVGRRLTRVSALVDPLELLTELQKSKKDDDGNHGTDGSNSSKDQESLQTISSPGSPQSQGFPESVRNFSWPLKGKPSTETFMTDITGILSPPPPVRYSHPLRLQDLEKPKALRVLPRMPFDEPSIHSGKSRSSMECGSEGTFRLISARAIQEPRSSGLVNVSYEPGPVDLSPATKKGFFNICDSLASSSYVSPPKLEYQSSNTGPRSCSSRIMDASRHNLCVSKCLVRSPSGNVLSLEDFWSNPERPLAVRERQERILAAVEKFEAEKGEEALSKRNRQVDDADEASCGLFLRFLFLKLMSHPQSLPGLPCCDSCVDSTQ